MDLDLFNSLITSECMSLTNLSDARQNHFTVDDARGPQQYPDYKNHKFDFGWAPKIDNGFQPPCINNCKEMFLAFLNCVPSGEKGVMLELGTTDSACGTSSYQIIEPPPPVTNVFKIEFTHRARERDKFSDMKWVLYDSNDKRISDPSGDSYVRHDGIPQYVYINVDRPYEYASTAFTLYYGKPSDCQPRWCSRYKLLAYRTCTTQLCGMSRFDCDMNAFNDWHMENPGDSTKPSQERLMSQKFNCTLVAI
ncbi:hypothetical protein BU16DRAFT_524969 [Lophium mytilinum]|uniref:Uncharacterized protein n=1 Tax=Lophium mytilinum TaxID=390894 RepID=A0A6A6R388_9PEZI|nr:hypothetical protein BU16DRAFT_524969 [Lophium mytilinum]